MKQVRVKHNVTKSGCAVECRDQRVAEDRGDAEEVRTSALTENSASAIAG